jgi:predicted aspartyl protease
VIDGTVSADDVPIILLGVAGRTWPTIVDTGFNGDLELPNTLKASVNPRFIGRMSSFLAGGQFIQEDYYEVDFPFEGQTITAEATFAPGGEILVGTHFLRDFRLEINFVVRTVLLDRVTPSAR